MPRKRKRQSPRNPDPDDLPWGPVRITGGVHKGRIGYYDDEEGRSAIVYFGDFFIAKGYFMIPKRLLAAVTTNDLFTRREKLQNLCGRFAELRNPDLADEPEEQLAHLAELHYVDSVLVDRMIQARYPTSTAGHVVFISHSSKDKDFARWIGVDLKAAGHTPWFDEWDIKVGESIPRKVSDGLRAAEFVVVVLSEHAVSSRWVEREWEAKYWSEIKSGEIHVLPALIRDCELPELLKTKRYADFRGGYNEGLEDLLTAIESLGKNKTSA
jgi:hypothetical protein